MLKRLHILCLALLAAATLSGCHRYLAREVRIVPKDIETYGSAGADVTLHVANRGGRPLRFEAAALSLAYDGGEVLRATLRDTVTVASGWEGDVRMRCRLRVPDRAALYAVQRKLQRAETQRMTVSFALRLRVGDAVKKNRSAPDAVVGFFEYLWPETRRFTNGFRMMKTIFFDLASFAGGGDGRRGPVARSVQTAACRAGQRRPRRDSRGARRGGGILGSLAQRRRKNGIAAGASISTPATGRMPASKPRR